MFRGATTLKLTLTAALIYSLVTVLEIKLWLIPSGMTTHTTTAIIWKQLKGSPQIKTLTTIPHLYQ